MVVSGGSYEVLRDPRSLLALGVLLTNDLILKVVAPGVLSGKLSDFAALIVFPILLTSVARFFGRDIEPRQAIGVVV